MCCILEVGTDTKRDNYTPKHKKFKLVGMNLCSMSVCSVFCQWVGVTSLCLLCWKAPLCLWCHE